MKSFFENNRGYFEKQGIAQKLKKADKAEGGCGYVAWLGVFLSAH